MAVQAYATVQIDTINLECASRTIECNYTVYNINSTEILSAATPIAFYTDTILVAQSQAENIIPIDGSESQSIAITIPDNIPDN